LPGAAMGPFPALRFFTPIYKSIVTSRLNDNYVM
jgi:hypothetical protein